MKWTAALRSRQFDRPNHRIFIMQSFFWKSQHASLLITIVFLQAARVQKQPEVPELNSSRSLTSWWVTGKRLRESSHSAPKKKSWRWLQLPAEDEPGRSPFRCSQFEEVSVDVYSFASFHSQIRWSCCWIRPVLSAWKVVFFRGTWSSQSMTASSAFILLITWVHWCRFSQIQRWPKGLVRHEILTLPEWSRSCSQPFKPPFPQHSHRQQLKPLEKKTSWQRSRKATRGYRNAHAGMSGGRQRFRTCNSHEWKWPFSWSLFTASPPDPDSSNCVQAEDSGD